MKSHSVQKLASFVTIRYVSFIIIISRGFMVASILGSSAFGLYAIVIMLQQQFSLFGLGVRESVSLRLANLESNDDEFLAYASSAIRFCILVVILLSLLSWMAYSLGGFFGLTKYNFHIAFQLASLTVGIEILTNIARARGMLTEIMVAEFGYASISIFILWFISLSFSTPENLLYGLLFTNVLIYSYYLLLLQQVARSSFSFAHLTQLVRLGVPILVQTISYTFVYSAGHYYLTFSKAVEQLGLYSFAFSLAIAAQMGVQAILWAQFSAMVSVFGSADESDDSKRSIRMLEKRVADLAQVFLVICFFMMKVFLAIAISMFFPDFTESTPIVIIIFMALYWPILATSEATVLLARKKFRKLYLSSGAALLVLALAFTFQNYGFDKGLLENIAPGKIAAATVFLANFAFYCMLKFHGRRALGCTTGGTLFDILKTVALVCILAGCYYIKGPLLPVLVMIVMLLLVSRKYIFKINALLNI